jgi:uncharacterized membrane protein YkvA (DUF1232 family)
MKPGGWMAAWKQKAHELKVQTLALYFACRDPRVPWYAKALAALVTAYALSPIDLIPDFIPILGYLDDLVLVPLGIYLAMRLIPAEVMADCQARAALRVQAGMPQAKFMAVVIVMIWVALLLAALFWAAGRLGWAIAIPRG